MKREHQRMVGDEVVPQNKHFKGLAFPSRALAAIVILGGSFCFSPPSKASVPDMVEASAVKFGVPVRLALAIAAHESGISCSVVGSSGERGPMQVLPATARHLGYPGIAKASCARQIDAGMAFLRYCYQEAGGNHRRAAACYNAGPRALTWRRLPKSVDRYVVAVLD